MKKPFPIADVLTVVTGVMLAKGADFQGVMDHLYPGIMTIGCAAMQPRASEEIMRQHPKLREFCRVNGFNEALEYADQWCDDFVSLGRISFGDTVEIEGPHNVSDTEIKDAFAAIAK